MNVGLGLKKKKAFLKKNKTEYNLKQLYTHLGLFADRPRGWTNYPLTLTLLRTSIIYFYPLRSILKAFQEKKNLSKIITFF